MTKSSLFRKHRISIQKARTAYKTIVQGSRYVYWHSFSLGGVQSIGVTKSKKGWMGFGGQRMTEMQNVCLKKRKTCLFSEYHLIGIPSFLMECVNDILSAAQLDQMYNKCEECWQNTGHNERGMPSFTHFCSFLRQRRPPLKEEVLHSTLD